MKKTFKIVKIILIVLLVLALGSVAIQRLSNNKINIFGFGIYTIVSESMKPEYEIGDMFISKQVKKEDIKVGDDIVYLGKVDSYADKVITHRVIRIDDKIYTKGTNNDLEDPAIDYEQVYGKVAFRLTILSLFSKLMNNSVLFYIVVFVPFTLLIFFDIKDIIREKNEKENELNKEEVKEEQPKE